MLASESAWRILRAEHRQLERLWARVDAALGMPDWPRPSQCRLLKNALLRFRSFDDAAHRPKGIALITALRGRSRQMDDLLGRLEAGREEMDRLLSQALALLGEDSSDEARAARCRSVLAQYGELLRRQLDVEDTALHADAARLLGEEDWSRIVSSISPVIAAAPRRRGRSLE